MKILSNKISVLSLAAILSFGLIACNTQTKSDKIATNWVDSALIHAKEQSLLMAKSIENQATQLPRSINKDGKLVTSGSDWWCSGFFPGVLWLLYEDQKDEELLNYASAYTNRLTKEQFNTSTHDLGFMLYCSFGNALRLTGQDSCKTILMNGAKSLATRYNPQVECIQSWEAGDKWKYPVIIDNMMNLEMLMWASKYSGNSEFKDISVAHSNKTLKNHFREDYSSYHVVSYNSETGDVEFQGTDQGYSDSSAWARGQAWGLYGYTMMFRETGDSIYLDQAHHIARFLLDHPRMPKDKIPYWDFDSLKIPNDFRDSSTAAIMASALIELSSFSDEKNKQEYFSVAEQQLKILASTEYTADKGSNGNFILKHGVGNVPQNSEIDAPLSYGDYYYIEALLRYKKSITQ